MFLHTAECVQVAIGVRSEGQRAYRRHLLLDVIYMELLSCFRSFKQVEVELLSFLNTAWDRLNCDDYQFSLDNCLPSCTISYRMGS